MPEKIRSIRKFAFPFSRSRGSILAKKKTAGLQYLDHLFIVGKHIFPDKSAQIQKPMKMHQIFVRSYQISGIAPQLTT